MIKNIIEKIWLLLFAYNKMQRLNLYLLNLSQKSLGVNNYQSDYVSGELYWTKFVLNNFNLETIFDIGAHKGDYTAMWRANGYTNNIYLFEPHPKTFSILANKIDNSAFTHLYNIGFSDTTGGALIFDYPSESKSGSEHASLYSNVITDLHGASGVSSTEVKITTLDDFVKEHNIERISLLKIDTEGHEYAILKGAKQLIEKDKVDLLQFEFGAMNVVSRHFFKDFYDLLNEKYSLYRLLPSGLLPIKIYNARQHEIFMYQNIVGIHKKIMK